MELVLLTTAGVHCVLAMPASGQVLGLQSLRQSPHQEDEGSIIILISQAPGLGSEWVTFPEARAPDSPPPQSVGRGGRGILTPSPLPCPGTGTPSAKTETQCSLRAASPSTPSGRHVFLRGLKCPAPSLFISPAPRACLIAFSVSRSACDRRRFGNPARGLFVISG